MQLVHNAVYSLLLKTTKHKQFERDASLHKVNVVVLLDWWAATRQG